MRKPGGAEAALERVALVERPLERVQRRRRRGEPLDGPQRPAVGLHGEHQAGAHRLAVELHRAGAADAVLAADVGAGQARARGG